MKFLITARRCLTIIAFLSSLIAGCGNSPHPNGSSTLSALRTRTQYTFKKFDASCSFFATYELTVADSRILLKQGGFTPMEIAVDKLARSVTLLQQGYDRMGGMRRPGGLTQKCGNPEFEPIIDTLKTAITDIAAGSTLCGLVQNPQKDLDEVLKYLSELERCSHP